MKLKKLSNEVKLKRFTAIIFIIVAGAVFLIGFTKWMLKTFGDVDFEQFLFSITAPTSGTPMSFYIEIAVYVVVMVVVAVLLTLVSYVFVRWHITGNKGVVSPLVTRVKKGLVLGCALSLLVVGLLYADKRLKVSDYLATPESRFVQKNYVKPTTENVVFPQKKKNLIYIYLESFEGTYFSKDLGGNAETNLMPKLTSVLEEPRTVSFSDKETYGGGYQAPSTGFSIAGMFSQQSGLPFKVPMGGNDYGEAYAFVPGAVTLGDVLQKEGYNMQFAVGADGTFAGVNNFYQTHGDWKILDLMKAREEGKVPEDYYEWWGFEDRKLFEFGKSYLDEMSVQDKPFALILEADDSHYPDGYTDAGCASASQQPYENSISCVDKMVVDFIDYVKQQDYYEDTVIVLHGDHLSMEQEYFKTLDEGYERNTFNAYINVDADLVAQAKQKNRRFYSMDVFPTVLAAMGVDVKGDRLGIGTDLFSTTPTFYEKEGVDLVNEQLEGRAPFFTNEFLIKESTYE